MNIEDSKEIIANIINLWAKGALKEDKNDNLKDIIEIEEIRKNVVREKITHHTHKN